MLYLRDELQLLHIVSARKQRLPIQQLHENAAHRPHIDGSRVVVAVEQQLWSSVPARHNVLGHEVRLLHRPGQPEVADLEVAVGVEKEVGRLEVAVEDPR